MGCYIPTTQKKKFTCSFTDAVEESVRILAGMTTISSRTKFDQWLKNLVVISIYRKIF